MEFLTFFGLLLNLIGSLMLFFGFKALYVKELGCIEMSLKPKFSLWGIGLLMIGFLLQLIPLIPRILQLIRK